VLVIDARGAAASVAAMLRGFVDHRRDVRVAGVIANRVGSAAHAAVVAEACAEACPTVRFLGALPRDPALELPSRHLGLVQAVEHPELEAFLERAAGRVAEALDLAACRDLAAPAALPDVADADASLPPLGQRIAVATDAAFAFRYPHVLDGWRRAGAALLAFSPLADQPPDASADAVYLPGGYPELHAGRLAANRGFLDGLGAAAARGAALYGECGGYMVLGRRLIDADGAAHAMAGLLPLSTSFAARTLHLGYRAATLCAAGPLGAAGAPLRGHEFHYATVVEEGPGAPLFAVSDAEGRHTAEVGRCVGRVAGSFIHLIDRV
jgi:cobyrinic acid a,c-diamide synthase